LPDVTVKRLGDLESNGGMYYRLRSALGVTSFGLALESWPAGTDVYPEHAEPEQEEVYIVLHGSATLFAGGVAHLLEPGVFARVGPGVTRRIVPGTEGVTLLAIGGVPGGVYSPPRWTEEGVPWSE
jgi:mannose-6-phosphate isomerase-like protein (cupin superfamily)